MREGAAIVAARDGAAFLTVEDVTAAAGVSRKVFYMFAKGATAALQDAAAVALDSAVQRIASAFDAQRDRPLAIRAAVTEALALAEAQPHWALLCVRDSHAQPIASGLDRERRLRPLIDRLQEHGAGDAPAWAALDAVEGAIRHALTAGAPTQLGELAGELVPLVLDLLGERRRGRGRILQQERSLAARVDEAFDRLPDSATELEALLITASADREGAALWRAFARLDELDRPRGMSADEGTLQRLTFDGLEEAAHFGLPVMAIADGASAPISASAGLFLRPLGELEQAALAILQQRPGITEDELRRALGITQARTRQIVGRLERGLVHRAPAA